jgi:hypothetical protein
MVNQSNLNLGNVALILRITERLLENHYFQVPFECSTSPFICGTNLLKIE